MRGLIRPAALKKGDLISVISPASAPADPSKIEKAVKYFESLGYRVKTGKNTGKALNYLSASDSERLEDIHDAFSDKHVKAVICTRGGYGSARLLDKINYNLLADNPKILSGFSDITALHLSLFRKINMVTFSGLMAAVDFQEINPKAEEIFWDTLSGKITNIELPDDVEISGDTVIRGRMVGGNLSIFNTLLGTSYMPVIRRKILFLEDVGEQPYRIDRMLNHLRLAGILDAAGAIITGKFNSCEEDNPEKKSFTLDEVLEEYLGSINKLWLKNYPFGHFPLNFTIPVGIRTEINGVSRRIKYLESPVIK